MDLSNELGKGAPKAWASRGIGTDAFSQPGRSKRQTELGEPLSENCADGLRGMVISRSRRAEGGTQMGLKRSPKIFKLDIAKLQAAYDGKS
jgi:hypothetical protein